MIDWFIQKNRVCLLHQGTGQQDPLSFPTGERGNDPCLHPIQAQSFENSTNLVMILWEVKQSPLPGKATHHHKLKNREGKICGEVLRNKSNFFGQVFVREIRWILPINSQHTHRLLQIVTHNPEQGRLPRPIQSHNRQHRPVSNLRRNILKQWPMTCVSNLI